MAPTAFWSDLHEDDSIYRSRPPPIPKVRAIDATARLLRPTRASLARAAGNKPSHSNKQITADMDKENIGPNGTRHPQPLRRRRLTIPQSPKFHKLPRRPRSRDEQLTKTSRELREIEALKKKMQETRRRNQRYHEATTRSMFSYVPANGNASEKEAFKQALQASGGLGIPTVRRKQLTTPIGFSFEIDKRADARKRKASHPPPPPPRPVPVKRFRF